MGTITAPGWFVRTAFAAAVVTAALGLSAAPASAHNYPVAYAPAEDAVVTEQPGVFSVTTNDNLLQLSEAGAGMGLQVSGPAGAGHPLYYGDGCVTVFGPTIEATAQLGEPGVYTVVWQVVSTDGHPVSGEYTFTWQPTAGQQVGEGSATPPDCNGRVSGQATPAADAAPPAGETPSSQATGAMMAELLWVGGAFAAVVVAVLATLFLVRRKPGEPEAPEAAGSGEPSGPADPSGPAAPPGSEPR
ncbi:copper resistance CopC family protein [Glaciibacter sp. 2TAF33]|uniref:copper resistance CopC family protein n=1 Tax=Glaciibacter sp. 2TAF33 TaxID=3233015 RepID=UPI003F90B740